MPLLGRAVLSIVLAALSLSSRSKRHLRGAGSAISPVVGSNQTFPADVVEWSSGAQGVDWVSEFVLGTEEADECAVRVQKKFNCAEKGCDDKVAGYINYLMAHECLLGSVKPLSFLFLFIWLIYLLYMLGDTADVFFCPTLDVIVEVFRISPNLAGVTFLSFGNGAPDVFASLSNTLAGNLDSGVSAILGAGIFVTTVVVGAVAMTSQAQLDRRPFLRDVGFYIVAVIYLMVCFVDKKVHIYEALGFIGIYVVFACVVVFGRRLYQARKNQRKNREKLLAAPLLDPNEEEETSRKRAMSEDFIFSERQSLRRDAIHTTASGYGDDEDSEDSDEKKDKVPASLEAPAATGGRGATKKLDAAKGRNALRRESVRRMMDRRAKEKEQKTRDARRSSIDHGHLVRVRSRKVTAKDKVDRAISSLIGDYHAPPTMLEAHTRRAQHLMEALELEDGAASSRDDQFQAVPVGDDFSLQTPKDSNEAQPEETGVFATINKYFGEGSTFGLVLDWILWPSTLIRQVSSPLLGEEDYDWRFCAATPLFGFPLILTTAYSSILSSGIGGSIGPIAGQSWLNPLSICLLAGAICTGILVWLLPRDEPPKGLVLSILMLFAFLTSVSWIIVIANEAVSLLVALGLLLHVSANVLNLTIMAWGNSIGDLVADVAVAKAGKPKMGLAAAFAGPCFNLLMGLGLSLTVGCLQSPDQIVNLTNPDGNNPLDPNQIAIVWNSFSFLLASLILSIIVIPLDKFRVRPWWGITLIVLYVIFLGMSLYFTFRKNP